MVNLILMIIGLSGFAGAGKDTVADILVTKHGYQRFAFADKIKQSLYDMNPLVVSGHATRLIEVVNDIGWDRAKREYPEIRRLLQEYGISGRKHFGKLHWVSLVLGQFPMESDVVITDVRFENEAEHIKFRDTGRMWRINRLDRPVLAVDNFKHISEHALDNYNFDYVINNNGTIEELETQVNLALQLSVKSYVDQINRF